MDPLYDAARGSALQKTRSRQVCVYEWFSWLVGDQQALMGRASG
jgi:hypothetical protein